MHPNFEEVTQKRIAATIENGKVLMVFGWMPKNHSNDTREINPRKVRFFERLPSTPPLETGLVVMTKFIGHSEYARVRSWGIDLISQPVPTGVLKRILCSLEILFTRSEKPSRSTLSQCIADVSDFLEHEHARMHNITPPHLDNECAEHTIPRNTEEYSMNDREMFNKAFTQKAHEHPEQLVSKYVMSKMLTDNFPTLSLQALLNSKTIEPVRAEGKKKVGWYRLCTPTDTSAPTTTMQKVQKLIAQEAELRGELETLERRKVSIENELERIRKLQEVLENLEHLVS